MKDIRMTKDPFTGKYMPAEWIPDHFAKGVNGVKFEDGTIYNPMKVPCTVKKRHEKREIS